MVWQERQLWDLGKFSLTASNAGHTHDGVGPPNSWPGSGSCGSLFVYGQSPANLFMKNTLAGATIVFSFSIVCETKVLFRVLTDVALDEFVKRAVFSCTSLSLSPSYQVDFLSNHHR